MPEVFVVSETRRKLAWFYDPASKQYVRREDDGRLNASINGHSLPDPHILTDNIQKAAREGKVTGGRLSADPVTYALWKHWTEEAVTCRV